MAAAVAGKRAGKDDRIGGLVFGRWVVVCGRGMVELRARGYKKAAAGQPGGGSSAAARESEANITAIT